MRSFNYNQKILQGNIKLSMLILEEYYLMFNKTLGVKSSSIVKGKIYKRGENTNIEKGKYLVK